MINIHKLKIQYPFYNAIQNGDKHFEIRMVDIDKEPFNKGDYVRFQPVEKTEVVNYNALGGVENHTTELALPPLLCKIVSEPLPLDSVDVALTGYVYFEIELIEVIKTRRKKKEDKND